MKHKAKNDLVYKSAYLLNAVEHGVKYAQLL